MLKIVAFLNSLILKTNCNSINTNAILSKSECNRSNSNRSFKVKFGTAISQPFPIKAGVPQGCISSPTLFSLYIADLNKLLRCDNGQYADDISIWKAGSTTKEIESALQADIKSIESYCQSWCIALSDEKTTYITCTRAGKRSNYQRKYSLNLRLKSRPIKLDAYPKLLGIPKTELLQPFRIT